MQSAYIGKVVDHYRIIERLGIGGMGVVFKAINIKIDKLVALKMIAPGLSMNKNFIKRFHAEAKALAKLKDFNIVDIIDLRSDNDQFFIVMEYVDGINLYDKIKNDGAYKCSESIPLLKQILTAIGHAHRAGIIHRDIKPNNIMVTKDGVVKITDFGLAKDQTIDHNTVSIASGGTLYYMSPEHVKGFSFTDKRSDLYSIGMTYYEMITGQVPFKDINSDFDLRERIVRKDFELPSVYNKDIPKGLEEIIVKSISKDPNDRYQTAEEMLKAVEDFEQVHKLTPKAPPIIPDSTVMFSEPETVANLSATPQKSKRFYRSKILSALLIILLLTVAGIYYPHFFKAFTQNSSKAGIPDTLIRNSQHKPIEQDSVPVQVVAAKPIEKRQTVQRKKAPSFPISFSSNPKGAQVILNGRLKGMTPLSLKKLKSGSYQLIMRKPGYADFSEKLIWKNKSALTVSAQLIMNTGSLRLALQPADAQIRIDGMAFSISDLNRVAVGRHQLEVSKPGYAAFRKETIIVAGKTTSLKADLKRLKGQFSIQVQPWGSIYINDSLCVAETDMVYEVTLPVDEYLLKVVHPSLGTWIKTIRNKADKPTEVSVDFNQTRAMRISATDAQGNPLQAEIYVDNKYTQQQTPAAITLPVGLRTISIQLPGEKHKRSSQKLMIDENTKSELVFTVEDKE